MIDRQLESRLARWSEVLIGECGARQEDALLSQQTQDGRRERPARRRTRWRVRVDAVGQRDEVDAVIHVVDVERQPKRGAILQRSRVRDLISRQRFLLERELRPAADWQFA